VSPRIPVTNAKISERRSLPVMAEDPTAKPGYKIVATIAALAAAFVARKSLAVAWKIATGNEPPANPEHPAVAWSEALGWAVASGAVVALARLVAQKKVAASMQKSAV
jgi:hypothetical protein